MYRRLRVGGLNVSFVGRRARTAARHVRAPLGLKVLVPRFEVLFTIVVQDFTLGMVALRTLRQD